MWCVKGFVTNTSADQRGSMLIKSSWSKTNGPPTGSGSKWEKQEQRSQTDFQTSTRTSREVSPDVITIVWAANACSATFALPWWAAAVLRRLWSHHSQACRAAGQVWSRRAWLGWALGRKWDPPTGMMLAFLRPAGFLSHSRVPKAKGQPHVLFKLVPVPHWPVLVTVKFRVKG